MSTQSLAPRTHSIKPCAVVPIAVREFMNAKSIAYAVETLRAQVRAKTDKEIFLRNVAEQARALTGAIGSVIALRHGDMVVCVAGSGEVGPPPGTPLDTHGGISGACLRSGESLLCRDSENDSRVDA